ncbi:MAG: RNA polymerase sigma factor [Bacteroidales bacterium]|jgi:RNA polymerase sigma-70 factor (ECF subfamily)|nr:RNA polymerase sigma factor [Bacteroidales bacterium]
MNNNGGEFQSDEEIIRSILREEQNDLYEILYERYYPKVLDKCFSLLNNREMAEEISMDILSRAYEHLGSFRGRSSFSSWLYAITYNYCIDYLRERKALHYPEWNDSQELPEIVDEREEDLDGLRYDRLLMILDTIHTEEKAMLMMKYYDDLSVREIATAMRVTESAAKMRLKRAKARVLFLYKKTFSDIE